MLPERGGWFSWSVSTISESTNFSVFPENPVVISILLRELQGLQEELTWSSRPTLPVQMPWSGVREKRQRISCKSKSWRSDNYEQLKCLFMCSDYYSPAIIQGIGVCVCVVFSQCFGLVYHISCSGTSNSSSSFFLLVRFSDEAWKTRPFRFWLWQLLYIGHQVIHLSPRQWYGF